MNFDLNQLLQGPVRDLALSQITKQLGISIETAGDLLNKGLSMVLASMLKKASSIDGANDLFTLIKGSPFQDNPLDLIAGKSELSGNNLLELGKSALPSLFGDNTDAITQHLADSVNATPAATKGVFGILLPIVFSVFKNKILGGIGLAGFVNLLCEKAQSFCSNLDGKSLFALGFTTTSFAEVLSNVGKINKNGIVGAAMQAIAHKATEIEQSEKSSGLGRWVLLGTVLVAALFGIKTCSDKKGGEVQNAQPATQTVIAFPIDEELKRTEGLGDLNWNKTDKDFTIAGTLQNDGMKASLLEAFKGLAGDLPLVDKLTVDAKAPQFGFSDFAGLTALFKEFPNVTGSFADTALNLAGSVVSEDAKSTLLDKAKALLGSAFTINADRVSIETSITKLGLGNLAWLKGDNDFAVSGTVQNEGIKAGILDAFKDLAGNLPLVDKLTVDEQAPQFGFSDFASLTALFKEFPNVSGSFADTVLNLVGSVVSEDAKSTLIDKANVLLGSVFSVNADNINVEPITKLVDGLGDLAWFKGESDFTVSGTVQNEGVRENILEAFKGLAGNLPLVDKLLLDENAPQFNFTNFTGLTDVLKVYPGVNGSFEDTDLNLAGQVATSEMKNQLVDRTKVLLGEIFSVNAEGVTVAGVVKVDAQAEPTVLTDMSDAKLDLEVVFSTGSFEIEPRYYNRLNAFAKFLVENKRSGEIAGYTDNVGNAQANQKLSEKRANAVRNYLVKQGVPEESLTAVGYGQENPIADNSTKEGRDKNRRIEFNTR